MLFVIFSVVRQRHRLDRCRRPQVTGLRCPGFSPRVSPGASGDSLHEVLQHIPAESSGRSAVSEIAAPRARWDRNRLRMAFSRYTGYRV